MTINMAVLKWQMWDPFQIAKIAVSCRQITLHLKCIKTIAWVWSLQISKHIESYHYEKYASVKDIFLVIWEMAML